VDIQLRNLERLAQQGDIIALQHYRRLNVCRGLLPEPIILILANLGYEPAQQSKPRYLWTFNNFLERLSSFDLIASICIGYRVIYQAALRILDYQEELEELFEECIPEDSVFFQEAKAAKIVEEGRQLLEKMTDCEYLIDLCRRGARAYAKASGQPWNRGWEYNDPLCRIHYDISHPIKYLNYLFIICDHPLLTRGGICWHFGDAFEAIGQSIGPPVGFPGEFQIQNRLHQLCFPIDGQSYTWRKHAWIEAIFSYYLL